MKAAHKDAVPGVSEIQLRLCTNASRSGSVRYLLRPVGAQMFARSPDHYIHRERIQRQIPFQSYSIRSLTRRHSMRGIRQAN
jgi:hypothetical protein